MREKDLLKTIFERLSRLGGMSNVFSADELADWPFGALELFKAQNLLAEADLAQSVECKGCEQYCIMPVNVRTNEANGKTKAFVSCDKPEDIGRVDVNLARLTQWKITGHALALRLAEMLSFEQDPKEKQRNKSWELGILKGKVNRPHIFLNIENGVHLKIGTHELELMDVLTFKKGKLVLDVEELFRIADKSEKTPKYKPSDVKREARKLKTEKRNKALQKIYRELKNNKPDMTDSWRAMQIKKQTGFPISIETIRKNMKS